ncbi:MAG: hypothetical protein AABZ08_06730 [Planctomycetota bacterium]
MGRIPLNPCDYFFFGQHQLLTRTSEEGNIAFMLLDVDGHIEPDVVRDALARTIARHPATMGQLRISFPRGRPYWKVPRQTESAGRVAAAQAYQYHDLRDAPDWEVRIARLHPSGQASPWNHRVGPQIRFEHYALPDSRTRIIFRWPHFMMDADGAQRFLSELDRYAQEESASGSRPPFETPASLSNEHCPVDVLRNFSFWRRVGLAQRGYAFHQSHEGLTIRPLAQPHAQPCARHEVVHRHWSSEQTARLQETAKKSTPFGPALYARHVAACVLRSLDVMYRENGVETEAYLITMPMRVGISQHDANLLDKRPVPGNYLVTPILHGLRSQIDDPPALANHLLQQFQDFLSRQMDMSQWALMWAASFIHKWSYSMIFKLPLSIAAFSSGYSYYGEIAQPIRSLCGRRVLNLWGGGPTPTPPGLNPVFSKFEDRLNLCLTYDTQVISDEMARRFVELIETQMFGGSAS